MAGQSDKIFVVCRIRWADLTSWLKFCCDDEQSWKMCRDDVCNAVFVWDESRAHYHLQHERLLDFVFCISICWTVGWMMLDCWFGYLGSEGLVQKWRAHDSITHQRWFFEVLDETSSGSEIILQERIKFFKISTTEVLRKSHFSITFIDDCPICPNLWELSNFFSQLFSAKQCCKCCICLICICRHYLDIQCCTERVHVSLDCFTDMHLKTMRMAQK